MLTNKDKDKLKGARTDKELKKVFKSIASKNPDEYFPTQELKKLGYMRKQCKICGVFFWTTLKERDVCGDPVCSGGFQVVINNPSPIKLSYVEVWKKIVEILEPRGYMPIKRYPCVARWNPTSEFTIASISAFQPYVITGEIEPPAKKLIIPQFCLRFNDIENVGVTFSHNTGFVMIGQHFFGTPEEWDQDQFFLDIHDFIHKGVGLPKEEITIHEDSWAGGGSFGCSLEFFSRGVELFNQVYTMFEQTPQGPKELGLKVLDMGLGQERVAWFSQGTPNIYEATFPGVLSKLKSITNIKLDYNLYSEFSKYSAYLNIDEVDNLDEAWAKVGKKLNMEVDILKAKMLPMTALYSIAEHARSLLFAINDGKLPSNVGGGYNLRVIFRRAIGFIDEFKWNIDIANVCEWHAEELQDLFPEVSEHLDEVRSILDVEKSKYYKTKKKASTLLEKLLSEGMINEDKLIELYDSKGINPEMVKEVATKYGKKVRIPDNFYSLVVERHEQGERIYATEKLINLDLKNIPETKSLYYYNYNETNNKARVLKIINNFVVLDQSVAYPTSGGQLHDIGTINNQKFSDVFKQGNHVIHVLDEKPKFNEGDTVEIQVDKEWRTQLSQHHTATHIVNAAAREILGSHINQAGAKKTLDNSNLDITHYEQIPYDKLKEIENRANEIVNKKIDLHLDFIPRAEAEQRYGMSIYQGGAVPGKYLRIVEIPGLDVEACGGTHLNNTSEAGTIKIIKSQKISDGVVRLTFTAGKATDEIVDQQTELLGRLIALLQVPKDQVVGRVKELIEKWKNLNKALETGTISKQDLILNSKETFRGEIIKELTTILGVKEDDIYNRIQNFHYEWSQAKEKLKYMKDLLSDDFLNELIENSKDYKGFKLIIQHFEDISQKELQNLGKKLHKNSNELITIFIDKTKSGILIMGMLGKKVAENLTLDIGDLIKNVSEKFDGKGGGRKDYGQGFIENKKISLNRVIKSIQDELKI
ncbi:MAG: alanine--tRNA ligase [Candidatus Lokiarchaeota archaeon]|nr:alanine--tRNA ligase [Candidatus Lokiarchaeota archaeon]